MDDYNSELKYAPSTDRYEQILHEYNTCCLCGSELTYTHVTNFVTQEVTEEAECQSCHIRNRKEQHSLQ
jgi:hypothetical protein